MKMLQNLKDGGLLVGYLAFLLTVVILGANGLAMLLG